MRRALVTALIPVAALSLVAGGYALHPLLSGTRTSPQGEVIEVSAEMGGFDRSVIRIPARRRVTIRFHNPPDPFPMPDAGKHQFAVDELGVNLVAPAGGVASVTFTAPKPGTYVFYCDVCCGGRVNPSMTGRLIVEEALEPA